jgi:hypothetical protein
MDAGRSVCRGGRGLGGLSGFGISRPILAIPVFTWFSFGYLGLPRPG